MKVRSKIAGILAGMVLLTGCEIQGPYPFYRTIKGYSGPDLPPEQVATVRLMSPLCLVGIDETELPKPVEQREVQLLPGMRIIKIGCITDYRLTKSIPNGKISVDLGLLTTEFGGYRVIDVNVEAGHTYDIECEFRKNADRDSYTWMTPVFDDRYAEQIKATIYDGMLKQGFLDDPRRPYKRE